MFEQLGYQWTSIRILSDVELDKIPDFELIQGDTKKKIYSTAVFDRYNFNWDQVVNINQTELNYYRDAGCLK